MEWVISLSELVVMVIAVATVAGAIALYRLTSEVHDTAERVNSILARIEPVLDQTMRELNGEVRDARRLTGRLNSIAEHGERLVEAVNDTAIPLFEDVDRIRRSQRYVAAAAKGVAAGFQAWQRTRNAATETAALGIAHDQRNGEEPRHE
jgi:uncharacterized protein YoxC